MWVTERKKVPENCSTCLYGPNAIGWNGKPVGRMGCGHADRQKDWMLYGTVRMIDAIDRSELRGTIQGWRDAHADVDDADGVDILDDVLLLIDAQSTLTPPNEAEKAIQRLGYFGKLFLDYSGSPRGPMGEPGGSTIEEWVTMMDPIQDVDGEWWRPVQEQALQKLLSKLKSLELTTPNEPLTLDELRQMVGRWVWVVVNYEHCTCDGWALVTTPAFLSYLDQILPIDFYGRKFTAYRRPPERGGNA